MLRRNFFQALAVFGIPFGKVAASECLFVLKTSEKTECYKLIDGLHVLHRVDGPAIECVNGTKSWWLNGKLHRDNGYAVEYYNGGKVWYQHGKVHRLDGPAVELSNGDKEWYQYDKLHRVDGPAIERISGHKEWWLHGKEFAGGFY